GRRASRRLGERAAAGHGRLPASARGSTRRPAGRDPDRTPGRGCRWPRAGRGRWCRGWPPPVALPTPSPASPRACRRRSSPPSPSGCRPNRRPGARRAGRAWDETLSSLEAPDVRPQEGQVLAQGVAPAQEGEQVRTDLLVAAEEPDPARLRAVEERLRGGDAGVVAGHEVDPALGPQAGKVVVEVLRVVGTAEDDRAAGAGARLRGEILRHHPGDRLAELLFVGPRVVAVTPQ